MIKSSDMNKTTKVNDMITYLANKVIDFLESDLEIEGVAITPETFQESYECALLSAGQEDHMGLSYLVKMEVLNLNANVYRAAWPEMHMDQNGNYTYDPAKWA